MAKAKVKHHRVILYITPDKDAKPLTEKQMAKVLLNGGTISRGGDILLRGLATLEGNHNYGTVHIAGVMNEYD